MFSPIFPLLLLALALSSLLWYQNTKNDIYQALAISSLVFTVLWALVLVHWTIHILSLIVLFLLTSPALNFARVPISKSEFGE
jgi:membrane-anchored glycerophosphoryl diester phosphodiesterase (GDPDase)